MIMNNKLKGNFAVGSFERFGNFAMPEKGKKERPLYVPPSRREEPEVSSSKTPTSPKPRLDVKLSKKEKVLHAWEVVEKEKKIVHAWEDQSAFKLPSRKKPEGDLKRKDDTFKGKHSNSKRNNKRQVNKSETVQERNIPFTSETLRTRLDIHAVEEEKPSSVTFVNANEYLAEMAASDWNDLDDLDYSKVPKWNH